MGAIVSRGIRNNNPGNLVKDSTPWQGLAVDQCDPKFWQFKDAPSGIRALARNLIVAQDEHNRNTVREIIEPYAPSIENNTEAYVSFIANFMEVRPDDPIDTHNYGDLAALVRGIITHENGSNPYTDAQIDKALLLAGVEPPKKSLLVSRQVIGSSIAAAATVVGPVVQQVQASLQPLTDYSEYVKHAFLIVALLGVALAVWAKIDERRKGIS